MKVETAACESCGKLAGERHKVTTPRPSLETLEEWMLDNTVETTDGCAGVEPDGYCEHGHRSWLLQMRMI